MNTDPRVRDVRRIVADSEECAGAEGDHERCNGRRCACGCHVDPWPFEHDG